MLLQASAIAIEGRAVLITGAPGSGKSSLALSLIDRGAALIGDDGVTLDLRDDLVIAAPPPNIEGLLEVRGVGLVTLATTSAPLALVVAIGSAGERLPDALPPTDVLGMAVPTLFLAGLDWTSPMRAERALQMHGLS